MYTVIRIWVRKRQPIPNYAKIRDYRKFVQRPVGIYPGFVAAFRRLQEVNQFFKRNGDFQHFLSDGNRIIMEP